MYKALDKRQLQIFCSFGSHGSNADALDVKRKFDTVKPSIYVLEKPYFVDTERLSEITDFNQKLKSARESPEQKRTWFEGLRNLYRKNSCKDFLLAEVNMLVESSAELVYFAEGLSNEQIFQMRATAQKYLGSPLAWEAIELILRNRIPNALNLYADVFVDFGKGEFIERERSVIAGFNYMLAELPELVPDIEQQPSLKVFLRYGSAHASLLHKLKIDGFNAEPLEDETVIDPSFRIEIGLKLSRTGRCILSESEKVKILFDMFYYDMLNCLAHPSKVSEDGAIKRMRPAFDRFGKEAGFLAFLGKLSRKHKDGRNLMVELLSTIACQARLEGDICRLPSFI